MKGPYSSREEPFCLFSIFSVVALLTKVAYTKSGNKFHAIELGVGVLIALLDEPTFLFLNIVMYRLLGESIGISEPEHHPISWGAGLYERELHVITRIR